MKIRFVAASAAEEAGWKKQFLNSVADAGEIPGDLEATLVDGSMPNLEARLAELSGPVFLILPEQARVSITQIGDWIEAGKISDILVAPFRMYEVLSKLRQCDQIRLWKEVSTLNSSLTEVVRRLEEDLKLAERLQKSKVPKRFPDIKGMTVSSRYLAGMKSGGDHFDLAEAASGNQLSVVLSDSSSYGLSSSVLSVLVRVAVKLTAEDVRSCERTVKSIQDELMLTLNEKDKLSFFYGTISRKDYRLRYVNLGSSAAFYAAPKGAFTRLSPQGPAISRMNEIRISQDEIELHPEGRLILVSDGFVEGAGGDIATLEVLNRFRDREATDLLNELVFRVKAKFTEPDDLPPQDCTAALFDVDARILRSI